MKDVLAFINDEMGALGLPYAFGRWEGERPYPYWVGEYIESPRDDESGRRDVSFLLTGTARGTWAQLEEDREKIERAFNPVSGLSRVLESGRSVAAWYESATMLPSESEDIKRLKVNIKIIERRLF